MTTEVRKKARHSEPTVKQLAFDASGRTFEQDLHLTEKEFNERGSVQQGGLL